MADFWLSSEYEYKFACVVLIADDADDERCDVIQGGSEAILTPLAFLVNTYPNWHSESIRIADQWCCQ